MPWDSAPPTVWALGGLDLPHIPVRLLRPYSVQTLGSTKDTEMVKQGHCARGEELKDGSFENKWIKVLGEGPYKNFLFSCLV